MTTAATISAKLILDSTDFDSGLDKAAKSGDKFASNFEKVGKKMQKVGAVMTAAITIPLALAVKELNTAGKEFVGIEAGFENFANIAGKSSDEVLSAMKEASDGLLSNRDAMLAFNNAAGLVNEQFALTLPDSMGLFAKVAAATGQSVSKVTSDYVTGIGRQSKMILDNLGITVDLEKANEMYAASIGKTVKQLTDEEKKLGLNIYAMGLLEEKYAGMTDAGELAGSASERFSVALQDLKDVGGKFVVETLAPLLEDLAKLANTVLPVAQKVLEGMPDPIRNIVLAFTLLLALSGPIIGFIGTILSVASSLSTLGVTFTGLSTAITGMGAAMSGALLPLLPILALIGAAVFLVWYTWKNWDDIKKGAWAIGEGWKIAFEKLSKSSKKAWADLKSGSADATNSMSEKFATWRENTLAGIGDLANKAVGAWRNIADGFRSAFSFIVDTARNVFNSIANAISQLIGYINQLKSAFTSLSVPDVLTPGSPTPFEIGLRGIGDAMKTLSGREIPEMNAGLNAAPAGIQQAGSGSNTYVDNRTFAGGMSADELKTALDNRFLAVAGAI